MKREDNVRSEVEVASRLRDRITSGRVMPNERLVEVELAGVLNTSRVHIRTALALLELEGLVVREPNRGARVRLVSDTEAIEIAEARASLEALTARQAAIKTTEKDKVVLRAIVDRMSRDFEAEDLIVFSSHNNELHSEIQRIAGNATVAKILEGLKSQLVRLQYRAILLPGRAEKSMMEHRAIAEAIIENNADAAAAAMDEHLSNVVAALKKAIDAGNRGFF